MFEKDEPFCFVFPISRQVLASTEPEIRRMSEDPKLAAEYNAWSQSRNSFNADLKQPGSEATEKGWQRDYFRGQSVSGDRADDHRTRQRVQPFKPLSK